MYYDKRLYHPHNHETRQINLAYRISSTAFIAGLIEEIRETDNIHSTWLQDSRVSDEKEADIIVDIVNNPTVPQYCAILNIQGQHDYTQQITYVPSNLGRGKGYIFYFICNGCGQNTKYLYMLANGSIFRCRGCNRLRYPLVLTEVEPKAKILNLWELGIVK